MSESARANEVHVTVHLQSRRKSQNCEKKTIQSENIERNITDWTQNMRMCTIAIIGMKVFPLFSYIIGMMIFPSLNAYSIVKIRN